MDFFVLQLVFEFDNPGLKDFGVFGIPIMIGNTHTG